LERGEMIEEGLRPLSLRIPAFRWIEDQEGLTSTLEDLFAHLPKAISEDRQVNSHNITVLRNTMIIAVLLRRPKES
jgi:hypothetical protein